MRWIGYAAGGALIVLGLGGLTSEGILLDWALWFGGVLAVHDAVLMPAVLLAGSVVHRWRRVAILSGTVTLATLPTVLALGRRADNASILPLNYGLNLLLALGATVLLALTVNRFARSDLPAQPRRDCQGTARRTGQDPADPTLHPGPGGRPRRGGTP